MNRQPAPRILSKFAISVSLLAAGTVGHAQLQLPAPESTDPVARGVMVGTPPPPDRRVTLANVLAYPNQRWAFHHMRELGPTLTVSRGMQPVTALAAAPVELGSLSFQTPTGERSSIEQWQATTYTDGLLILHRGRIAYEKYGAGMGSTDGHALWSVSKSFVGLLTAWLIQEGTLDPNAPLVRYVPELARSAWADATVQQTLDMTTAVAYTEVFANPRSDIYRYLRAGGLIPAKPGDAGPTSLYDFLVGIPKEGEHGATFRYKSADIEVLGWVLRRVTGKSVSALLSERIWSQLGPQEDAYYWLDGIGTDVASVGLNATLRDLGRFGELVRQRGRLNNRQIVPAASIDEIRKGADRQQFASATGGARSGYSYHDGWWIAHDADQSFEAKGVFGQHLHINPAAELVIVKLSSHPVPDTQFTHALDRAAFAAIASALRGTPVTTAVLATPQELP